MNMETVTENVVTRLKSNIANKTQIKEDTFRYYYFAEMLAELKFDSNNKDSIDNFVLEYPYSKLTSIAGTIKGNPELDTYYKDDETKIAIEFKYLVKDDEKTIGKPNRLAQIYSDIIRLSTINDNNIMKYFIYVETPEMRNYKHAKEDKIYTNIFKANNYNNEEIFIPRDVYDKIKKHDYPETFNKKINGSSIKPIKPNIPINASLIRKDIDKTKGICLYLLQIN